jgi:hypothetical protein
MAPAPGYAQDAERLGPMALSEPPDRVVTDGFGEVRFLSKNLAKWFYILRQEAKPTPDGRLEVAVRVVCLSGKHRCEARVLYLSADGDIAGVGALEFRRLEEAHPQTIRATSPARAARYVVLLDRPAK